MTAFNHRYYNKENLKERDRHELDFWFDEFMNAVANAECEHVPFDEDEEQTVLGRIHSEIAAEILDDLREHIGWQFDEIMVSIIDNYDDEVPEVKNFTTYSMDVDGSSAEDDPMEIFRRIRESQPQNQKFHNYASDDDEMDEEDEVDEEALLRLIHEHEEKWARMAQEAKERR